METLEAMKKKAQLLKSKIKAKAQMFVEYEKIQELENTIDKEFEIFEVELCEYLVNNIPHLRGLYNKFGLPDVTHSEYSRGGCTRGNTKPHFKEYRKKLKQKRKNIDIIDIIFSSIPWILFGLFLWAANSS